MLGILANNLGFPCRLTSEEYKTGAGANGVDAIDLERGWKYVDRTVVLALIHEQLRNEAIEVAVDHMVIPSGFSHGIAFRYLYDPTDPKLSGYSEHAIYPSVFPGMWYLDYSTAIPDLAKVRQIGQLMPKELLKVVYVDADEVMEDDLVDEMMLAGWKTPKQSIEAALRYSEKRIDDELIDEQLELFDSLGMREVLLFKLH